MPTWATLALTAVVSAAPAFIQVIPHPYDGIASGLLALIGSIYHLFQTSPTAK